ncbi:PREDICTED: protein YLS9-like [Nelumbo nucifera]|uniref:Protein YLS9-like n=1 Tax=Nelumbo nucifera TaxID=4432 RepID=A0A1U7Z5B2_NELNU|nr:PREDICTED: protein YLS9-like [Nelumbo nucifera]
MAFVPDDRAKYAAGYTSAFPPPVYYPPAYPTGGYPYTAATPRSPSPPPHDACSSFLRRMIILVIVVTVVMGLISIAAWFILPPQVPEIRVESFSVSNFNLSSSILTAKWDVAMNVNNPSEKVGMVYDRVHTLVLFGERILTAKFLPPFYLEKRDQTTLNVKFTADSEYMEGVLDEIMQVDRRNGEMLFNLRMTAFITFKNGIWTLSKQSVRVYCDYLRVGLSKSSSGAGTLIGGPRDCLVYL